ncbi:MAG: leucine-rich repeat domain-containing protein [Clostridia bacterium]|nr:leucine-rich repeat domain-containing protein [Clostridia bacterium]
MSQQWYFLRIAIISFCFLLIGCETDIIPLVSPIDSAGYELELTQNGMVLSGQGVAPDQHRAVFHSEEDIQKWMNDSDASAHYTEVVFGDEVSTIPAGLFENCMSITTVDMGNGVVCVESKAFYGCVNLTSVVWSPSLTRIESSAFEGCGIRELILPQSVTTIQDFAFTNCIELETCFLPDSITEMGCNFTDCTALKMVHLPACLESLEDYSFSGCTALESVTIPAAVKVLGYDVFSDSGIACMVIAGELDVILSLRTSNMPFLKQIVFCGMPPKKYGYVAGESFGLMNNDNSDVTVYCMDKYLENFSPTDGKWNGFSLIALSDLAALPPQ